MAGFRKAKAEQAALKMGLYGPPGCGKTFTSLLCAEGLASHVGKRIAFVDTERGTDFYCKAVKERRVHPEAFDFDALYTRSITEIIKAVKSLNPSEYGVVVIDSMTHLWEACRAAYTGNTTSHGSIPLWAWGKIKAPYKDLMNVLLSSPMHVIICGRQKNEYEEDDEGELKKSGVAMKAEGETAYEPHILIRMEAAKQKSGAESIITAYVEKDRTGILTGKVFREPSFDSLCRPLLHLLGDTQAKIENEEETALRDAETIAKQEAERATKSEENRRLYKARMELATTIQQLKAIGKELTPAVKKEMLPDHVKELRDIYGARESALTGRPEQPSEDAV